MSTELPTFISPDHRDRLAWFDKHKGEILPMSGLQEDTMLAFKPKGIYKPAGWEYSLSIRINRNSPYGDGGVQWLPDGGWRLRYYQENADPADRDKAAGNRGLMQCMEDKVPVGVLREALRIGRQTQYEVLGLATPVNWEDGFFLLENATVDVRDLELAARSQLDADAEVPQSDYDARLRVQQQIVRRQGQSAFRGKLMEAYQGRCAVTACDAPSVLEAAHLCPYRGPDSNQVTNGLLLRADIHTLLDLGMLAPDPATRRIKVSPQLAGTYYGKFDGRPLAEPVTKAERPAEEALQMVWQEFLRKNNLEQD
jgi:putative restriction endonuclease